ncbi:hypothetical protein F5Y06DRAFT_298762 [Hypoxylon sp. FL0890]|nr:hypothetical protein F5Y06DRAFT_298762 [Hypoxylon sp. FL0890]
MGLKEKDNIQELQGTTIEKEKSTLLFASIVLGARNTAMVFGIRPNKSKAPKHPPNWVNSVLRCTYNDGQEIIRGLDALFGANGYILKHRNGRWVVWASRKLTEEDENKLEDAAHIHYRPPS